jgi:hypothetical protein
MLQSNLAQQSVFIIGDGSLLNDGVMELLAHRPDLLISRAIYSDASAIKSNQSDVILVCESGSVDTDLMLNLISSHLVVTVLLILVIRLRNNAIDIYEKPSFVAGSMSGSPQRIVATTGDDLVNVLMKNFKR